MPARDRAARRPTRRSQVVTWVSGIAAVAMVATIAVIAAGYDAREAPREEPSVWAMRSSGQYARVNTLTAEIDTVRSVDDPSGVLQSGAAGVVLTQGGSRAWPIDAANPADLVEEGGDAQTVADTDAGAGEEAASSATRLPDGTRETIVAGGTALLRTEAGEVFLSAFAGADGGLGDDPLGDLVQLDPYAEERAEAAEAGDDAADDELVFEAAAAAIDADGDVALYSAKAGEVRWYSAATGEFGAVDTVPGGAGEDDAQLAIVGDGWVLFEPEAGLVWRSGSAEPVELAAEGEALLQASSGDDAGETALIADAAGLWEVGDGGAERTVEYTGAPAQPVAVGDERVAAWIGQSDALLWTDGAETPLRLDDAVDLPGDPEPAIRSNGSSALVSEIQTGMMWTVPDGELIPVEQWTLVDPPKERDGTVVVSDVTEQEPPVAVDDEFGVRAGEPTQLPVLLNDYDPNRKDVLTIDAEGIGDDLDEDFGALAVAPDGQSLVVTPADDATGRATFTYRVTDGYARSKDATVTLAVADPGDNTAPAWCPVEGCQREWPSPELAPGGTLVYPILEGWVDPEGDPMMLADATVADADAPVRALVTADGRLALRHEDDNAADGDVPVTVEVADADGETTQRTLTVQVRSDATAVMSQIATTVVVGEPVVSHPLTRITGGSGSYALVDAAVQTGDAKVTRNESRGTLEITADDAGVSIVTITAQDRGTEAEITGQMRITAVDARGSLGIPPLRAFVRPLADTTVDVLAAVPGANSRALVVQDVDVRDGELRADVIEHAQVRVSGATPDGEPGRIGSADVVIAEGDDTATARLTVFQVPETTDTGAIAVADSVTVRAGEVVDIDVLDNDVSPPGQRLVLHPDVSGSGATGELAFASGNTLRYRAPAKAGSYTLTYTTYGASSPEGSDIGHVHVTVVSRDGNRDPQPATLTARVSPGDRTSVTVPLSGVDPDGDRVRLVGVEASDDARLSVTLAPRTSALQVSASSKAETGTAFVDYTVRDSGGGEGTGRLRIIVTDSDPSGGAPITYSDYVRLEQGAVDAAVVRPLDNDIDPSGGRLELVDVVPNVSGGKDSAEYRRLERRLDTSDLDTGRVRISGGDGLGTVSYKYTVKSSETSSTADGLIVVQVSARVGQQAPTVRDTVLSVRDRAELEQGGVDVVTDRVYWATGDASTLRLSVVGSAAKRYTASGTRISGPYTAEGATVTFKLSGTDVTGAEVVTYGFLVIPPLDELRLTLKPGLRALTVDEGESISASLADLVDLGAGDRAEFKSGSFTTQRDQASCTATGATRLEYAAGKGSPWTDTCLISVKLEEQSVWTQLAVPVEIVPDEPVAELRSLTRTVAPGTSETIDLTDMVRWEGGREGRVGDLAFNVSAGGGSFDIAPAGARVTVTAHADAVPGAEDAATVTVTGAGEASAPLVLRVGEAAKANPRGGTVSLSCTVGSSCRADVIGVSGEYDPYEGKSGGGLELVGVDGGSCAYGTLSASGDAVSVGWPDGSRGSGGRCTATFTVEDAQGHRGTGTIELDARGVPRAPASISQASYDASSVTLEVRLSSTPSHPDVSGVRILRDGSGTGASCSPSGGVYRCTVRGLENGEKHAFTAVATNDVGDSDPTSNSVTAWAYSPPDAPQVTAKQVSAESTKSGTVELSITGARGTRGYRISSDAGGTSASGRITSVRISGLSVGAQSFTVTPLSEFDPPPGAAPEGSTGKTSTDVGGLPSVSLSLSTLKGSDQAEAAVTVDANGGGDVSYGARRGDSCSPDESGNGGTIMIDGSRYETMTVTACARNNWGSADSVSKSIRVGGDFPAPSVSSGWVVGPSANNGLYGFTPPVVETSGPEYSTEYLVNGSKVGSTFPTQLDAGSVYTVRQCLSGGIFGKKRCSDEVVLSGNAPTTVKVNLGACIASDATQNDLAALISNPGGGVLGDIAPSFNPATGAFRIGGAYDALQPVTATVCPEPEPEPTPPPEGPEG